MLTDLLNAIIDVVQGVDPTLRALIVGLAILAETTILIGLVIPGDTILLVASTGVQGWGQWAALVAAGLIGALIGESLGFLIGRHFGPALEHSWLGRRIGEKNWQRARVFLARRGGTAVFVSRFLPVLHALVPVTAGLGGMSYRKFIRATIPACTIWALAYVSVGALATAGYQQLGQGLHWAGYIFVAVIVVFVLIVWLIKRHLGARFASDLDHSEPDPGSDS